MSIYLSIAIIIFLLIFAAAAALTLLSLIGKVKMPKNYQKQLFTVLLLEVIGVVVSFVTYNLKPDLSTDMSERVLMNNNGRWEWCFPEAGWRTKMDFIKDTLNGSLTLKGTTYYYIRDSNNIVKYSTPVYEWASTKPIDIPSLGKDIHFEVTRTTLDGIKISEPGRYNEIGKIEKGVINLTTSISLAGEFKPYGKQEDWGIVLNYRK